MNKTKSILVASLIVILGLASCNTGNKRRDPGRVYAPDMFYSRAYDAYTSNPNFADSQTSRPPVTGTIAVGHMLPDHLAEGDTTAYKTYTTSLRFNEDELAEGKRLFMIYCAICHGPELDGNGPLYKSGKFAAMPANFKDAKYLHMPVGQMYAAVKYGKNMMGSYASQIDIKQRWMILAFIKKTQSENGGDAFAFGSAATTASAAAATDTTKAKAPVADANKKG
ncbi:MAG: cytochrome c [Bacteroidetes bacterium]|nr:cytochrome c [Bacteroidota bacterium]